MTLHQMTTIDRRQERGTALVGVLLLLMMMTALASALAVSGRTETLVARNHQTAAQARAAAEAGLNRAAQVAITWLAQWPNTYANVYEAVDALLADPTLLDTTKIDFDETYTLASTITSELQSHHDLVCRLLLEKNAPIVHPPVRLHVNWPVDSRT